jgi:hypothetical protein
MCYDLALHPGIAVSHRRDHSERGGVSVCPARVVGRSLVDAMLLPTACHPGRPVPSGGAIPT